MRFIKERWQWWRDNRDTPIALKKALLFMLLVAALTFSIGRFHPAEDYRRLLDTVADLRTDTRQFAQQKEKNEREIIKLRASLSVNEKLLQELQARNADLAMDNTHRREEAEFFRRILGRQSQDAIKIYALEKTPDFRPDHRRLSAVLVRGQAKKPFKGGYYFEVVEIDKDNTRRITRSPASANTPLVFDAYIEIEQVLKLPPASDIEKLRMVIVDEKNNIVAENSIEENIAISDTLQSPN